MLNTTKMEGLQYSQELIDKAKSWALRTQEVIVYPIPSTSQYGYNKMVNGKRKKISKAKVNIGIRIGNAVHVGKHLYEQEQQLTDKVNEIYAHYYLKAHPYANQQD